jgi:ACS family hexuronate transporter-like MFS transporter
VISAPLIAFLYVLFGWKATFAIVGLLGFVWIVPWWFVHRADPARHPWLGEDERKYILDGETENARQVLTADTRKLSFREILAFKQSWSVIISRFFLDPIWWMFVNWLPIYLAERFGFDIKQIGLFAWVPYVGAALGSLLGGWWSGHMIHRGWTVNKARKWTIVAGGVVMFPAMILSAYAATPLAAVLLIAVILFGFQVVINNVQTLPSDFFSGKFVGTLAGLGGSSAVLGVLATIWLVPILTKLSYVPFFMMGALLVPLGIVSLFAFAGTIEKIKS